MLRHAVLVLLVGLGSGCMKAAAPPAGVAPLVIPVAEVRGGAVAIGAPPEGPRPSPADDGHRPGEHVTVESRGSWLTATLLERRADRWLVRYDERWGGARDALEELVETRRIGAPAPPADEEHSPDDVDP